MPGRNPEEERCTRGIDGLADAGELERGVKPDRLAVGIVTRGIEVRDPGAPAARGADELRLDPPVRVSLVGEEAAPGTLDRRNPEEFVAFDGRLTRGVESLGVLIRLERELGAEELGELLGADAAGLLDVRGVKPEDRGVLLGADAAGDRFVLGIELDRGAGAERALGVGRDRLGAADRTGLGRDGAWILVRDGAGTLVRDGRETRGADRVEGRLEGAREGVRIRLVRLPADDEPDLRGESESLAL